MTGEDLFWGLICVGGMMVLAWMGWVALVG